MPTTSVSTTALSRHLARLRRATGPDPAQAFAWPAHLRPPGDATEHPCIFEHDQILARFVHAFLLWESTTARADAAFARVCQSVVDINELRASLPEEIADVIGANYPRARDRAARLKAALNDIFAREHRVRLSHLETAGKKATLAYLTGLAQTPRFVAARVALVDLGVHAMPVDSAILRALADVKGITDQDDPDDVASLVERTVTAGELLGVYAALQAQADTLEPRPAPKPKVVKAAPTPAPKVEAAAKPAPKVSPKPVAKSTSKAAAPRTSTAKATPAKRPTKRK